MTRGGFCVGQEIHAQQHVRTNRGRSDEEHPKTNDDVLEASVLRALNLDAPRTTTPLLLHVKGPIPTTGGLVKEGHRSILRPREPPYAGPMSIDGAHEAYVRISGASTCK